MSTYLKFLIKILCGYVIGSGPLFGFLIFKTHISIRDLARPYLLLFIATFVCVLLIYDARKYVTQPKALSLRYSLAILTLFLSSLLVFNYYGVKFKLFAPGFESSFLWSGILLTCLTTSVVFYTVKRKTISGEIGPR